MNLREIYAGAVVRRDGLSHRAFAPVSGYVPGDVYIVCKDMFYRVSNEAMREEVTCLQCLAWRKP